MDKEPPNTFCEAGCTYYPSSSGKDQQSGKWYIFGPLTSVGVPCTPGDPSGPPSPDPEAPIQEPVPEDAPTLCKAGTCPGQVNGVDVCMPCSVVKDRTESSANTTTKDKDGNTVDQGQTTTKTTTCEKGKCTTTTTTTTKTNAKGPDGGPLPSDGTIGETNTSSSTTTNADGSKTVTTTTTETTTTCTEAGCTKSTTTTTSDQGVNADGTLNGPPKTTVTTSDPEKYAREDYCKANPLSPACRGETSKTTTETKDQASFCKENPKSPMCVESTFGGGCGGPPACTGDAIQCAIATMAHEAKCKLFEQTSAESALYDEAKLRTGNQTGDLPGNETISLTGRISTVDALGGSATGLQDLTVTVWGSTVNLPFSMLNDYLAALGNVLVAVSFLIAVRIVGRA